MNRARIRFSFLKVLLLRLIGSPLKQASFVSVALDE
jgi:hypothetical protein